MKKEYVSPECEIVKLKLSKSILGDSKPEPSVDPIYNPNPPDDPFA